MPDTLVGVEPRTARVAGTVALVAVVATALVLEPRLQDAGYGVAALAIYAAAGLVLLWSVFEDLRQL